MAALSSWARSGGTSASTRAANSAGFTAWRSRRSRSRSSWGHWPVSWRQVIAAYRSVRAASTCRPSVARTAPSLVAVLAAACLSVSRRMSRALAVGGFGLVEPPPFPRDEAEAVAGGGLTAAVA